jgi:hypothetical protein
MWEGENFTLPVGSQACLPTGWHEKVYNAELHIRKGYQYESEQYAIRSYKLRKGYLYESVMYVMRSYKLRKGYQYESVQLEKNLAVNH